MARVFLSPSTQTWNVGAYEGTNEQEEAYKQAEVCARILREHGVEVRIGTRGKGNPTDGYWMNANESNDTGPWDAHVCFHTDAGGATGTTLFHYPNDARGRELAQLIYNELAPGSPGADHGVRARSDLYELNSTLATAVLGEAAPHDRKESSNWIQANPEFIGAAYAKGILRWLGIEYKGNGVTSISSRTYAVQKGDTLSVLSRRWGVTVSDLVAANPEVTNPDLIPIGQKLNVPANGHVLDVPVVPQPASGKPAAPALPQPFPLPSDHYYGDIAGSERSHGGYYANERPVIKIIQQRLIAKGYVPGITDVNSSWADGLFEQPTVDAVARFQRAEMPGTTYYGQVWWDDYAQLSK